MGNLTKYNCRNSTPLYSFCIYVEVLWVWKTFAWVHIWIYMCARRGRTWSSKKSFSTWFTWFSVWFRPKFVCLTKEWLLKLLAGAFLWLELFVDLFSANFHQTEGERAKHIFFAKVFAWSFLRKTFCFWVDMLGSMFEHSFGKNVLSTNLGIVWQKAREIVLFVLVILSKIVFSSSVGENAFLEQNSWNLLHVYKCAWTYTYTYVHSHAHVRVHAHVYVNLQEHVQGVLKCFLFGV